MPSAWINTVCRKCGKYGKVYRKSEICRDCTIGKKPAVKPVGDANFQAASTPIRIDFIAGLMDREPAMFKSFASLCRKNGRSLEDQLVLMMYREVGVLNNR